MITFSNSFKFFLKENKERSKVIKSLYEYTENPKIIAYKLMIKEEEINYITFRGNGMISYMPKGKEQTFNADGTWKKEGRQEGKPAKVIRKLFTDKAVKLFKESDLDCFNNIYKSHFNTELEFELLDRHYIKDVYEMERKSGGSSLNSSCMNGDSEYLDIYQACKSLSILILRDKEGLLCGRALVWNADDLILIDRIYVSDDYMFQMFFDYAQKKQMVRKYEQSYANKATWLKPNGEKFTKYFNIETDTDFEAYPYIDTFSYGGDGFLTNTNVSKYEYDNTDGTRGGDDKEEDHDNEIYDEINDEYIYEDDAVQIDYGRYRNHHTHYRSTVTTIAGWVYWIDSDEIIRLEDGRITEVENATFCEYTEKYHLIDDCTYVSCGEYANMSLHNDYVVADIDGNNWFAGDSGIVLVNGLYYPFDSKLITEVDGEYCLIENLENN
jgi:hypothetical protein